MMGGLVSVRAVDDTKCFTRQWASGRSSKVVVAMYGTFATAATSSSNEGIAIVRFDFLLFYVLGLPNSIPKILSNCHRR
jgi:hypothetical protein